MTFVRRRALLLATASDMDAEAYNKSYAGGRWWVDQCGWGRGFSSEAAADEHIALMEGLTAARKPGRLWFTVKRKVRHADDASVRTGLPPAGLAGGT
jgi:hypothetical protein